MNDAPQQKEAHKRRVLRVQTVLYDLARGGLSEANALMLLEEAGVSTGAASHMIDTHRPRARLVRPWVPGTPPASPEPPRAA